MRYFKKDKTRRFNVGAMKRLLSMLLALNMLMTSMPVGLLAGAEGVVEEQGGLQLGDPTIQESEQFGHSYAIRLGERTEVRLSELIKALKLPVLMQDIELVGEAGDGEAPQVKELPEEKRIDIEPVEGDYVIRALRSFDEAGLYVYTSDWTYHILLRDALVTEPTAEEQVGLELGAHDDENGDAPADAWTYRLNSGARLSDILADSGLGIGIADVEMVGLPGSEDGVESPIDIQDVEGDYVITAHRDFDEARVVVHTASEAYTIALTGGVAVQPEAEPAPAEADAEKKSDAKTEENANADKKANTNTDEIPDNGETANTNENTNNNEVTGAETGKTPDAETDGQTPEALLAEAGVEQPQPEVEEKTPEMIGQTSDETSNAENQQGSDETPAAENQQGTDETPAAEKEQGTDETPAENQQGTDETPAENQQGTDGTPAAEKEQGTDETPAENQQGTDEIPAENQQGTDETPAAEKEQGSDETPAAEKEQDSDEIPAAENQQGSDETPASENQQGSDETPAAENQQGSDETPAAEKEQGSDETPAAEKEQGTDETPAENQQGTDETPAENQQGTDETPAENQQGTDEIPAENQQGSDETPAENQQGTDEIPAENQQGSDETPAENQQGTDQTPGEDTGASANPDETHTDETPNAEPDAKAPEALPTEGQADQPQADKGEATPGAIDQTPDANANTDADAEKGQPADGSTDAPAEIGEAADKGEATQPDENVENPDAESDDADADLIVIGPTAADAEPQQAAPKKRMLFRKAAPRSTASYETALLHLSLNGPVDATVSLRRAHPETPASQQVLEAYSVVEFTNCEGINVALSSMPELEAGEYLSLYGLQNGYLALTPMADHLVVGDGHTFPLSLWDGFALVREGKPEYQELDPVETDDAVITLSGVLPEGATVEAAAMPVENYASDEGSNTLLATDITVRDAQGEVFQPAEGETVEVTVKADAIGKALEMGSGLKVLHYADDSAEPEEVEVTAAEGDALTFAAPGFSVYVVQEVILEKTLDASDGNAYKITVAYDTASGIPANAELIVEEISQDSADGKDYAARAGALMDAENAGVEAPEAVEGEGAAQQPVRTLAFARSFDIRLINPADGTAIQPDKNVRVSIELLDTDVHQADQIGVVHFGAETEKLDCALNGDAVEVETSGFSVYTVVGYTVDFHWGEYTYSIEGESDILLSDLLRILGASDVKNTNGGDVDLLALAEDMSQIASVTFSDPELLDIQEVESIDYIQDATDAEVEDEDDETLLASLRPDWLLISLAPFDTNETLTLTLTDGHTVEIAVTDLRVPGSGTSNRTRVTADGVTYTITAYTAAEQGYPEISHSSASDGRAYYGRATVYALSAGCTIHDEIEYGGNLYKVWNIATSSNNLTRIGAKMDREFVNRAAGYKFELPEIKLDITQQEKEALAASGFVFGKNNEKDTSTNPETPAADNKLWKKATYDPATNTITYDIKTFQTMKEKEPLDFIFIYDDSITMYTGDRGAPVNRAADLRDETVIREAQGTRIMILSAAQALMGKGNAELYNIRMAMGGASNGDNRRSGWFSHDDTDQSTGGYAGVENYLASYATGATSHETGVNNALTLARQSVSAGRKPIVIYLSDFKDGRYNQSAIDQLHSIARVYTLQTADRRTPYPRAARITTDPDTTFFNMSEIDEGVQNLENIILDAIGYYMKDKVTITDNLSDALSGKDVSAGTISGGANAGSAPAGNGKSTWTIGGTSPYPGAGQIYTETFTVQLDDETIYAGAMPTNGDATLNRGGKQTNSITPDSNDPDHLHMGGSVKFLLGRLDEKDNMHVDGKGVPTNLVSGIQFALVRDEDDEIIDYYTTVNGAFEIPYKKTITEGGTQREIVLLELGKTYSLQEIDSSVEAYNADKVASDMNNPKLKKPDKHWIISVAANGVVTVKPEEAASQTPNTTIAKATPGDSQANPPTTGTPPRIVLWNKIVVPAILIPLEIKKTWVGGTKRDPVPFTIYGVERSNDTNPGKKHPLVAYDAFNAETANVVGFIGPGNKGFKESGDVWTQKVYVLNEVDNHTFYDYENFVDLNSMTSGQVLTVGDITLKKEQWAQLDEDGDGKVPYGQTYSYAIEEGDLVYEEGWYTPTYNNNATSTTLNVRQGNIPAQSADEKKSWLNYVSDYGGSTTDSLYFELDIYDYVYGESDKADFNKTLDLAKNDYTLNHHTEKQKFFERLRSLEIVVQDTGDDDTYYRITVPVSGSYDSSGDSDYSLGAAVFGKIRTPESWKNYAGNWTYGNIPKSSLEVREVYAKFDDEKGYVIYSSGPGVDSATGVNITRKSSVNNNGNWGLHLNSGLPVGDHWHTTAMYRFLNYSHYDKATVTPAAQTLEIYARKPSAPAQTVPATEYTLNSCTLEIRNSWNPNVLMPLEVTKKWENATAADKQSITFSITGTTNRGGKKSIPIFTAPDNAWSSAQTTGTIEKTSENQNSDTWTKTVYVPTIDVLGTYDRTKDPVCEAYTYSRTDLTDAEIAQMGNDITELTDLNATVDRDADGVAKGEWETGTPQYADGETVYSQTEFEWKENSSILTGDTVYLKLYVEGVPTSDSSEIKAIRVVYKEQIGTYQAKRIIILNLDGGLTQGDGYYYIPFRFSDDIQKANGSNQFYEEWGYLTEEVHTIEDARKKIFTQTLGTNNWSLVAAPVGTLTATLKDAFFAWQVPKVESMTLPSFTMTNTFTPNAALTLSSEFNDASLDKVSTKDIGSVVYTIEGTTNKGAAYSRTVTTTAAPADASSDDEVSRTFSKRVYVPKGAYTITETAYTVGGQRCATTAYTVTNAIGAAAAQNGNSRANYALNADTTITFNNARKQMPVKVKMDWEPGLVGSEDPLAASGTALQYTIFYEDSHHTLHPLTGDSYELTQARQEKDYSAIPTYSVFGTYTVCELDDANMLNALPDYNLSVVPGEQAVGGVNTLVFTIEAHIKRGGIGIEKHFDEAFSFNDYKGATLTYTITRDDGENIYGTGTKSVTMTITVPSSGEAPEMLTGEIVLNDENVTSYYNELDAKTKEAYQSTDTISLPILRSTDVNGGKRVKYVLTESVSGGATAAYFPTFTDQSGNSADAFEQTNPPGQNADSTTFGDANKAKFILNPSGIVVGINNADAPYICKIEEIFNGVTTEMPFRYLNAAVKYARENITMDADHPVTIQMLVDYVIPGSNDAPGTTPAQWAANDRVVLGTGTATAPDGSTVSYTDNIILTTAATSGGVYNFVDTAAGKASADLGKAILTRGYTGASLFTASGGSGLTLTNIILDGDKPASGYTGHTANVNGGLVSADASNVTVTNGAILRNSKTSTNGGAVSISGANGTLAMSGGEITNCEAPNGGGVSLGANGTLTMTGGEIKNNTVTSTNSIAHDTGNGGGVHAGLGAVITMSGGKISGNTIVSTNNQEGRGGGVCLGGASMTLFGTGEISDNSLTGERREGGGVYIGEGTNNGAPGGNSSLTMSGGKISGNTADIGGGVATGYNGVFTISGGEMSGNTADRRGGAINHWSSSAVTVSGGKITNNTATLGSAIYVYENGNYVVNLSGGEISGNHANGNVTNEMYGGAINVKTNDARLNFSGTIQVKDNTTTWTENGTSRTETRNVVLTHDTNEIIQVLLAGLDADAEIGVYVTGDEYATDTDGTQILADSLYNKRGIGGTDFGRFDLTTDDSKLNNLIHFKNDRNGLTATNYKNEDASDNKIYWNENAAYIKILNMSSIKDLYFKIIIDDGKYGNNQAEQKIYKRGSQRQAPTAREGDQNNWYFPYDMERKIENGVLKGASETIYIPNGVGLKCSVEVYKDKNYNTRIETLTVDNLREGHGSLDFADWGKGVTLVSGPRYKIPNGGTVDNPEYKTSPGNLANNGNSTYYSSMKNCIGSSYNQAVLTGNYLLFSLIDIPTAIKLDETDKKALAGAEFSVYTDAALTTPFKVNNNQVKFTSANTGKLTFDFGKLTMVSPEDFYLSETDMPTKNADGKDTVYANEPGNVYRLHIDKQNLNTKTGGKEVELSETYGISSLHIQDESGTTYTADGKKWKAVDKYTQSGLVWSKSTDDTGFSGILNRPAICKIVETKTENGNTVRVEHTFTTLNAAVDYARQYGNGEAMSATNPVKIEMLVDYVIPQSDCVVLGFNDKNHNGTKDSGEEDTADDNIIFTTAAKTGGVYNFTPTFTGEQGRSDNDSQSTAILKRGYNGSSLFTVNNSSAKLTTTMITLDGSNKAYTTTGVYSTSTTGTSYVCNTSTGGNGHGGLISVPAGTVNLNDDSILRNSKADQGGAVCVVGTLIENGAKFLDNYAVTNGGAVCLESEADATFTDVYIDGHTEMTIGSNDTQNRQDRENVVANAGKGGGLYISKNAVFTFTGGHLIKLKASERGGAIDNLGKLTMTKREEASTATNHDPMKGSILYCTAENGGAIYNGTTGTIDMTGGYIEHCIAADKGGGIYTESTAKISTAKPHAVDMHTEGDKPGVISDCEAANGGGIYVAAGKLDMTGGTIQNCKAKKASKDSFIYPEDGFRDGVMSCNTGNGGGIYNKGIVKLEETANTNSNLQKNIIACAADVHGGGIYVAGNGKVDITGGSILDCSAGWYGGAIYDNATDDDSNTYELKISGLTIQGHTGNSRLPDATPNARKGGGIYMADGHVEIRNSKIYDCTALIINTSGNVIGGQGGAIFQIYDQHVHHSNERKARKELELIGVTIDGHYRLPANQVNAQYGGAIYVYNGCHGANAGAYADHSGCNKYILKGKEVNLRQYPGPKIIVNGGSIVDCTVHQSGGAIYCDSPALNGDNTIIIQNGAVINGHESLAAGEWNANCKTSTGDTNLTNQGGGAIYFKRGTLRIFGYDDLNKTNPVSNPVKILNCTAQNYGGAIFGLPAGTATDQDGEKYTAKLENCLIDGHTTTGTTLTADKANAGQGGGAVYMKMSTVTIQDCTLRNLRAPYGAAILGRTNDGGTQACKVNIIGGLIEKNIATADNGGAVNAMSGLAIADAGFPTLTGAQSGWAVCTFSLEGNAVIYNNFGVDDLEHQQKNLVLTRHISETSGEAVGATNAIINTTKNGLGQDAHIGVYVTGGDGLGRNSTESEPYTLHGGYEDDFGTYDNSENSNGKANLHKFTNDRNGMYGAICSLSDGNHTGEQGHSKSSNIIRWESYLCKLTDKDGKLLYMTTPGGYAGVRDVKDTVTDTTTTYYPAVYMTLKEAFNAMNGKAANGTSELKLYTADGAEHTIGSDIQLHMLRNYTQPGDDRVTYVTNRLAKFTTAKVKASENAGYDKGDVYVYSKGSAPGVDNERATITRGADGTATPQSMLTVDTAKSMTLTGIIFDGAKTTYQPTVNGGIVNLNAGALNIQDGATLRNSQATSGGAVYAANGTSIMMTGGALTNNTATSGGAVYVVNGATVTLEDGTKTDGTTTTATHAEINGNSATTSGAGIYLEEGGKLNLSGSPDFGGPGVKGGTGNDKDDIVTTKTVNGETVSAGNFLNGTLTGKQNGLKAYTKARQDIYIAETGSDNTSAANYIPASIMLTGDVTSGDGTVWVWAENQYRYKQLLPFAVIQYNEVQTPDATKLGEYYVKNGNTYTKTTDTAVDTAKTYYTCSVSNADSLKAFRNAQDDETTENGTDTYLFGTLEGEVTDQGIIYWSGSAGRRKVILRKVSGTDGSKYAPLAEKTFNIYKGNSNTVYNYKAPGEKTGVDLKNLTSTGSGVFWVGYLPYGWYILEETSANKYFYIVVTANGTWGTVWPDGENKGKDQVDGFTRENAVLNAVKLYQANK